MSSTYGVKLDVYTKLISPDFDKSINNFDLKSAMDLIWVRIMYLDGYIQTKEPFKRIKSNPEEAKNDISFLLNDLRNVAEQLLPFLPKTAEKIIDLITKNKMPETPLFPRK